MPEHIIFSRNRNQEKIDNYRYTQYFGIRRLKRYEFSKKTDKYEQTSVNTKLKIEVQAYQYKSKYKPY